MGRYLCLSLGCYVLCRPNSLTLVWSPLFSSMHFFNAATSQGERLPGRLSSLASCTSHNPMALLVQEAVGPEL